MESANHMSVAAEKANKSTCINNITITRSRRETGSYQENLELS